MRERERIHCLIFNRKNEKKQKEKKQQVKQEITKGEIIEYRGL